MPDSPETWRCFVALPIPATLRATLEATVAAWRGELETPNLRWTDPDGWHVTLAFLGQTNPNAVPGLVSALAAAVRPFEPLTLSTGRLGAFPRPGAAQSAWVGIDDPDGRLRDLGSAVQEAVLALEHRRPLRAHLTIGRSRARRGEPLGTWLAGRTFPATELPVDEVVLYHSHLGRGPAQYEALGRVRLRSVRD